MGRDANLCIAKERSEPYFDILKRKFTIIDTYDSGRLKRPDSVLLVFIIDQHPPRCFINSRSELR